MRKIRRRIFETNSSSSHVICVTKNDRVLTEEDFKDYPEHLYIHNGELDLSWREEDFVFDRHPFKFLCTFEDKLRFVIASLCGNNYNTDKKETFETILNTVKIICPEVKSIKLPKSYSSVWFDEKNCEYIADSIVHYNYDTKRYYYIKNGNEWTVQPTDMEKEVPFYGSIDHQSSGLLQRFLLREGITIKEFLENKKYVVIIDGDEYCDWDSFKYSGLIDIKNIEKEFGADD